MQEERSKFSRLEKESAQLRAQRESAERELRAAAQQAEQAQQEAQLSTAQLKEARSALAEVQVGWELCFAR